jgi:hypothetical protein
VGYLPLKTFKIHKAVRRLPKPTEDAGEVYLTCISNFRDPELKKRLTQCTDAVQAASKEFELKVVITQLHTIAATESVGGLVTTKEMEKVYTQKMAKKGAPGRVFYDKLLAAPAHGRCPLCGQRTVSTLDHHLPKTHYPVFAVLPVNLVPACADCNKVKLALQPKSGDEETIHPYFDNIDRDLWLYARIEKSAPASAAFYVRPPAHWDAVLARRVQNHFTLLRLPALYASHAAEELANISYYLNNLFTTSGSEAVRSHLAEAAESRSAAQTNSWQTALYRALSESKWFYTEGLQL